MSMVQAPSVQSSSPVYFSGACIIDGNDICRQDNTYQKPQEAETTNGIPGPMYEN